MPTIQVLFPITTLPAIKILKTSPIKQLPLIRIISIVTRKPIVLTMPIINQAHGREAPPSERQILQNKSLEMIST
jgi:hypothetical protein